MKGQELEVDRHHFSGFGVKHATITRKNTEESTQPHPKLPINSTTGRRGCPVFNFSIFAISE